MLPPAAGESATARANATHACQIMRSDVVTVQKDTAARSAFATMLRGGFRHLLVTSDDGKLEGIVSDRDIREIAIVLRKPPSSPDDYLIVGSIKVAEIMVADPVTVAPDDPVCRAARLMADGRFSCVPVVEDGKVVGIITVTDLLNYFLALHEGSCEKQQ